MTAELRLSSDAGSLWVTSWTGGYVGNRAVVTALGELAGELWRQSVLEMDRARTERRDVVFQVDVGQPVWSPGRPMRWILIDSRWEDPKLVWSVETAYRIVSQRVSDGAL